jgi:hypothetical protein
LVSAVKDLKPCYEWANLGNTSTMKIKIGIRIKE